MKTLNPARLVDRARAAFTNPDEVAARVRTSVQSMLRELPWKIRFIDWTGARYEVGGETAHWSGLKSLDIHMKTVEAGSDILALDFMRFLERYLDGEVDLDGNIYLLAEIRNHAKFTMKMWQVLSYRLRNLAFQTPARARKSVNTHYDIDQRILDEYLDKEYLSYSTGMWKRPWDLNLEDATRIGKGESDEADTLEASHWRKFAHAADFLAPEPSETVLDIGCGYGGFSRVLLERHRPAKVVGWTHSKNQVNEARRVLAAHDPATFEINEGDYRNEDRVYDHIHSCEMVSHVGKNGLVPYVQWVRKHIRSGGRYMFQGLMTACLPTPLESQLGPAFHMRYVWPGFYWFTLGQHLQALEQNGFHVLKVIDLGPHYAKTLHAWYQRMVAKEEFMIKAMGEPTYRAFRIYLGSNITGFIIRHAHVYRVLCQAYSPEEPSLRFSDPRGHPAAFMPLDAPYERGGGPR